MPDQDPLKKKLNDIEEALEAPLSPTVPVDDLLGWHLSNITVAIEGGGGGGSSLRPEVDALKQQVTSLTEEVDKKQDELISGSSIKTINGSSILGPGDIEIVGDITKAEVDEALSKKQDNLGFEGDYNKETNKVATASYVTKVYEDNKDGHIKTLDGDASKGVITNITKKGDTLTVTSKDIHTSTTIDPKFYVTGIDQDVTGRITGVTQTAFENATAEKAGYMSKEDKTKIDSVEENAQENIIEKVNLNGNEVTITDKTIDLGNLTTKDEFDTLDVKVGDPKSETAAATGLFKTIEDEEKRATTAETELTTEVNKKLNSDDLATEVGKLEISSDKVKVEEDTLTNKLTTIESTLGNKADKTYVDEELVKKQDTLTSGTNIKTINGEDLLGEGDITIAGDVTKEELNSLKTELTTSISKKVSLPGDGSNPQDKSVVIIDTDGTTSYGSFPDTSNFASLNDNNIFSGSGDRQQFGEESGSRVKIFYNNSNPEIHMKSADGNWASITPDSISTNNGTYFYPEDAGTLVTDETLNDYQKKSDTTLNTTDKTVVGAINENFNSIKGLSGIVAIKQVNTLPTTPDKSTMYYVGTASPYQIILIDTDGKQSDLGTTAISLDEFVKKTEVYLKSETYNQSEVNTKLDTKITKPAAPSNESFLVESPGGVVSTKEIHIYQHAITMKGSWMNLYIVVFNNSSNKLGFNELANLLWTRGFVDYDHSYSCTGTMNISGRVTTTPIMRCYAESSSTIRFDGPAPLPSSSSNVTLSSGTLKFGTTYYSSGYGSTFNYSSFTTFNDVTTQLM